MAESFYKALDINGKDTGQKLPKGQVHGPISRKDLFCATAHIWMYSEKGEVLLQKRSKHMSTWPEKWDISSAGHIDFGEEPLKAAEREVHEELGIKTSGIEFIKELKAFIPSGFGWDHNEFTWVYLLKIPSSTKLTKQKEEVADLKWLPLANFDVEVHDPVLSQEYVPHGDYYDLIISEIRKRI